MAAIGIEHKLRGIETILKEQREKVKQETEHDIVYDRNPITQGILDTDKRWSERAKTVDLLRAALRRCANTIEPAEVEKIAALPNQCAANTMRARVLLIEVDGPIVNALAARGPTPQINQLIEINKTLTKINNLVSSTAGVCKHEIEKLTKAR
ncbi:hypothetical protein WT92_25175 [Burkholderia stagnalis]|uniref:Uncharacterized protein n=1 Tax=Burkholderia stagnalis TaxID=1503054 RepID=A0A107AAL8_9BURK|nr:hypothetical protein WT35_28110 [Burkholderia stagnalis]KWA48367.1 hypothetical protein WT43_32420 [Burkholderia stagnalis]KWA51694.1 hypothetical protein WT42_16580 [Burkholderia stagnalis]KWA62675.1 hypothetical protein WT44_13680 [Burkholderia stagnalis]KWC98314.1 hypothetical protein WT46_23665 [Burkholderia stagnalis]